MTTPETPHTAADKEPLTTDDILHMIDFGEVPRTVSAKISAVALRQEALTLSIRLGEEVGLHGFHDIYMAAVPAINNDRL